MIRVEDEHPWYQARLSFVREILRGHDPETTSILDFGCGAGGALNQCKELGFQTLLGVDTSDVCVDATLKRGIPAQRVSHSIPNFPSNSFDLIFALDVIEHLNNDLDYLVALKGWLRAGGEILVTVPAHEFLWSYHDVINAHFRRYSKKQLTELAEKAGLEIEKIRWWNSFLLPYLYFARRLKKHKEVLPDSEYELPPKILLRPLRALLNFECTSKILSKVPGVSLIAILTKKS
jgi:SAM-dependent methyltransferase